MRTELIAGFAVLAVAVIFIIQNAHSANISFLGVHLILILPLAAALLLAAADLPGVTQLRQIIRRGPAQGPGRLAAHDQSLPAHSPRQMTRERMSRP
jgi:hypothetical protein